MMNFALLKAVHDSQSFSMSIEDLVNDELAGFGQQYKDLLLWGDTAANGNGANRGGANTTNPDGTTAPTAKKDDDDDGVKKTSPLDHPTPPAGSATPQHIFNEEALKATTHRLDLALCDISTVIETLQEEVLIPLRSILLTSVSNTGEYKGFLLNVVDAARQKWREKQRQQSMLMKAQSDDNNDALNGAGEPLVENAASTQQDEEQKQQSLGRTNSMNSTTMSEAQLEDVTRNNTRMNISGKTDPADGPSPIRTLADGDDEAAYRALRHDVWVMPVAVCVEATENALTQVLQRIAALSPICWEVAEESRRAVASTSTTTFNGEDGGAGGAASPQYASFFSPNGIVVDAIALSVRQTPAKLYTSAATNPSDASSSNNNASSSSSQASSPHTIVKEKQATLSALIETLLIQWSRISAFLLQMGMLLGDPNHAVLAAMVAEGLIGVLESEINHSQKQQQQRAASGANNNGAESSKNNKGDTTNDDVDSNKWGCFGIGNIGVDGIDMECESTRKLLFLFEEDSDDENALNFFENGGGDDCGGNNDDDDDDSDERSNNGSPFGSPNTRDDAAANESGGGSFQGFAPKKLRRGNSTNSGKGGRPSSASSPNRSSGGDRRSFSRNNNNTAGGDNTNQTNNANLRHMAAAIFNVKHPAVIALCEKAHASAMAALAEEDEEELARVAAARGANGGAMGGVGVGGHGAAGVGGGGGFVSATRRVSSQGINLSRFLPNGEPRLPRAAVPTPTFTPAPTLLSYLGKAGFGTHISNLIFQLCNTFLRGLSLAIPHFHYKSSNNYKARILMVERGGAEAPGMNTTTNGNDNGNSNNGVHSLAEMSMAAQTTMAFFESGGLLESANKRTAANQQQQQQQQITASPPAAGSLPTASATDALTRPFIDMIRGSIYTTKKGGGGNATNPNNADGGGGGGGASLNSAARKREKKEAKKAAAKKDKADAKKIKKEKKAAAGGQQQAPSTAENDTNNNESSSTSPAVLDVAPPHRPSVVEDTPNSKNDDPLRTPPPQTTDDENDSQQQQQQSQTAEIITPTALFTAAHSLFCTAMGIVTGMLKEDATTTVGLSFCPSTGPLRYYYARGDETEGEPQADGVTAYRGIHSPAAGSGAGAAGGGDVFVWDGDFAKYRDGSGAANAKAVGNLSANVKVKKKHNRSRSSSFNAGNSIGSAYGGDSSDAPLRNGQQIRIARARQWLFGGVPRTEAQYLQLMEDQQVSQEMASGCNDTIHKYQRGLHLTSQLVGEKGSGGTFNVAGGNGTHGCGGLGTTGGVPVVAASANITSPSNAAHVSATVAAAAAAGVSSPASIASIAPAGAATSAGVAVTALNSQGTLLLPVNLSLHQSPFLTPEPAAAAANGHTNNSMPIATAFLPHIASAPFNTLCCSIPLNVPAMVSVIRRLKVFALGGGMHDSVRVSAPDGGGTSEIPLHFHNTAKDVYQQLFPLLTTFRRTATTLNSIPRTAADDGTHQSPDILIAAHAALTSVYHHISDAFGPLLSMVAMPDLWTAKWDSHSKYYAGRAPTHAIPYFFTALVRAVAEIAAIGHNEAMALKRRLAQEGSLDRRVAKEKSKRRLNSSKATKCKNADDENDSDPESDDDDDVGGIASAHQLLAMLVATVGKRLFLKAFLPIVATAQSTKVRHDQLVGDGMTVIKYARALRGVGVPYTRIGSCIDHQNHRERSSRSEMGFSESDDSSNNSNSVSPLRFAKLFTPKQQRKTQWWNALVEVTHRLGAQHKIVPEAVRRCTVSSDSFSSPSALPTLLQLCGNHATEDEEAMVATILVALSARTTSVKAMAALKESLSTVADSRGAPPTTDATAAAKRSNAEEEEDGAAAYDPKAFLESFWFPRDENKRSINTNSGALMWEGLLEKALVKEHFGLSDECTLTITTKTTAKATPAAVQATAHQQMPARSGVVGAVTEPTIQVQLKSDVEATAFSLATVADITALMQFGNSRFVLNADNSKTKKKSRSGGATTTRNKKMPSAGQNLWPMRSLDAVVDCVPPLNCPIDLVREPALAKGAAAVPLSSGQSQPPTTTTLLASLGQLLVSSGTLQQQQHSQQRLFSAACLSLLPLRWEVWDAVSRGRLEDDEKEALDECIAALK